MRLTGEEEQIEAIIKLLAQGKTNAYITKEIHISKTTLKRRLSKIYTRFKASDRTKLVISILKEKQGLI